jgi:hypothetical protein
LTKQILVWNYPKEDLFNQMTYKILSCLIEISFNESLSLDFFQNGTRLMYVHATFGYQIWYSMCTFKDLKKKLSRLWNLAT